MTSVTEHSRRQSAHLLSLIEAIHEGFWSFSTGSSSARHIVHSAWLT